MPLAVKTCSELGGHYILGVPIAAHAEAGSLMTQYYGQLPQLQHGMMKILAVLVNDPCEVLIMLSIDCIRGDSAGIPLSSITVVSPRLSDEVMSCEHWAIILLFHEPRVPNTLAACEHTSRRRIIKANLLHSSKLDGISVPAGLTLIFCGLQCLQAVYPMFHRLVPTAADKIPPAIRFIRHMKWHKVGDFFSRDSDPCPDV